MSSANIERWAETGEDGYRRQEVCVRRHCRYLALALLAGCGSPTRPAGESVRLMLRASGVVATNRSSANVYYFVVERQTAALVSWAPCTDPDRCPKLGAEASITVPYAQIYGWPGSGEVIFYWWHLVPSAGGGFHPDSIRAVVGTS